jgi:ferredoxin
MRDAKYGGTMLHYCQKMKAGEVPIPPVAQLIGMEIAALRPGRVVIELEAGKTWDVSHKTIAVAAGLGVMGLNRLVLSPRLGSTIILNSILINAPLDRYDQRLDHNPCLNCRLCAAVCPTGAVKKDGAFDFLACATHSYRDLSGAIDWEQGYWARYRSRLPRRLFIPSRKGENGNPFGKN